MVSLVNRKYSIEHRNRVNGVFRQYKYWVYCPFAFQIIVCIRCSNKVLSQTSHLSVPEIPNDAVKIAGPAEGGQNAGLGGVAEVGRAQPLPPTVPGLPLAQKLVQAR